MRLIFLCSGNTCRSPLAVAAWDNVRPEVGVELGEAAGAALYTIAVTSAGLCAQEGAPAAKYSQEIAHSWHVDLARHRARVLTEKQASEADLILTMTQDQAAVIKQHFPVEPDRVQLLGAYAPAATLMMDEAQLAPLWGVEPLPNLLDLGPTQDILDPYGASLEAYLACANHIRACVRGLALSLAREEL